MTPLLNSLRLKTLTLLILSLLIILVGCDTNNTPPVTKVHLTVGGKLDREAQLLTKMYVLLLRKAGFDVTERAALGQTDVVFQAIRNGTIDLYPEFTGTQLIKQKIPSSHDPHQDYLAVKDFFESQFHITWLDPAPLNDGYALCTSKDEAQMLGIKTISDLAPLVSKLILVSPGDGISFIDNLKSVYGFDTSSFKQTQQVDYESGFTAVANNQAQVNVCYTTDGSVALKNFVFLQDNNNGFPEFHPAPIIRDDVLKNYPKIKDTLNQLAPKLTTDVSIMLQAEVISHMSVTDVAVNWLKSQELL